MNTYGVKQSVNTPTSEHIKRGMTAKFEELVLNSKIITSISDDLTSAQDDISTLNESVSGLDERVTTLEDA